MRTVTVKVFVPILVHFPYFEKKKTGVSDYLSVCVSWLTLLGNGSVKTFSPQPSHTQQYESYLIRCFPRFPCHILDV
jgi:hypothetical protein